MRGRPPQSRAAFPGLPAAPLLVPSQSCPFYRAHAATAKSEVLPGPTEPNTCTAFPARIHSQKRRRIGHKNHRPALVAQAGVTRTEGFFWSPVEIDWLPPL